MFRNLFGLLFGVALSLSAAATNHYPPTASGTRTTVTVRVIWLDSFKHVDVFCSWLAKETPQQSILGCYDPSTVTIFAVQPTSFNDVHKLEILGHEFWHALGAQHPA